MAATPTRDGQAQVAASIDRRACVSFIRSTARRLPAKGDCAQASEVETIWSASQPASQLAAAGLNCASKSRKPPFRPPLGSSASASSSSSPPSCISRGRFVPLGLAEKWPPIAQEGEEYRRRRRVGTHFRCVCVCVCAFARSLARTKKDETRQDETAGEQRPPADRSTCKAAALLWPIEASIQSHDQQERQRRLRFQGANGCQAASSERRQQTLASWARQRRRAEAASARLGAAKPNRTDESRAQNWFSANTAARPNNARNQRLLLSQNKSH